MALTFHDQRGSMNLHSRAARGTFILVFVSLFSHTHAKTVGDTCARVLYPLVEVSAARCAFTVPASVCFVIFELENYPWCHLRLCARPRTRTVVAMTTTRCITNDLFFFLQPIDLLLSAMFIYRFSLDYITLCEISLHSKSILLIWIHKSEKFVNK